MSHPDPAFRGLLAGSRRLRSLGLLVLMAVAACDPQAEIPAAAASPGEPEPTPVLADGGIGLPAAVRAHLTVEPVGGQGEAFAVRAPARVAFRDSAVSRVGAPIASRVMKLHVKVGDRVKVGDELATLASPGASGYHAELARAKVERSAATASLLRQEEMLAKGVGREQERVMARMHVLDAEERVRAAKRDVGLLGKSFGGTVIVTSQLEGTVLRRNATVGAQVEPGGDPLFEIGNPEDLWVVADVFQDDLDLVRPDAPVKVTVNADGSARQGRIASVGVLLDTAVRRAPVYIELEPSQREGLKAGMFARAEIASEAADGIVLPTSAVLLQGSAQPIVYVERADGTFERRDVEIGHSLGDRVEVVAGLDHGERVVTRGALLIDGAAGQLL